MESVEVCRWKNVACEIHNVDKVCEWLPFIERSEDIVFVYVEFFRDGSEDFRCVARAVCFCWAECRLVSLRGVATLMGRVRRGASFHITEVGVETLVGLARRGTSFQVAKVQRVFFAAVLIRMILVLCCSVDECCVVAGYSPALRGGDYFHVIGGLASDSFVAGEVVFVFSLFPRFASVFSLFPRFGNLCSSCLRFFETRVDERDVCFQVLVGNKECVNRGC